MLCHAVLYIALLCSAVLTDLEQITADLASLGYEPPVGISATSGDGMADLYQLLQPLVDTGEQQLKRHWQQQQKQQRSRQQPLQASAAAQQQLQQQQQEEEELWAGGEGDRQQLGAVGDAAVEEAAVDALVQQHMAATAAATSDDESGSDSDSDSESSYLAPAPRAVGSTADDDDADMESSSEDEQPGDESSLRGQGDGDAQGPLRLAILGLPNAGKSTLMNSLLGFERSLTGEFVSKE